MNYFNDRHIIIYITFFLISNFVANSQETSFKKYPPQLLIGAEYYFPTKRDRKIETLLFNILLSKRLSEKLPIFLTAGFTATYASGYITQYDNDFNEVSLYNNAAGFGPVILLKYEHFLWDDIFISPECSGGFVIYTEPFPSGGEIYNFMWRFGGSINYQIPKISSTISFSIKWMHVSNGKGLSPENPSYEGVGLGVNLIKNL